MKRILVIDGQGGSLGKLIVEKICSLDNKDLDIIAVGTNVIATQAMLRAGASEGATGENPVIYNSSIADIIIGPIRIAFGMHSMVRSHRPWRLLLQAVLHARSSYR